jgi:hypothetical protein
VLKSISSRAEAVLKLVNHSASTTASNFENVSTVDKLAVKLRQRSCRRRQRSNIREMLPTF